MVQLHGGVSSHPLHHMKVSLQIFHPFPPHSSLYVACQSRPLTLETLFTELHLTVTDQWKKLGELLKIDEDLLDEIFTVNETDEECLKAILEVWLQKSTNLTWKDVTHALKELGNVELAESLCHRSMISV